MCTQGSVPVQVRSEKRNQITGLKEDTEPEELPHVNDLTPSVVFLLARGDVHTLPLWVCICLASVSAKQPVSLCALPLVPVLCP